MLKVTLEAQLSKENLLAVIQQLSATDLEEFMQSIMAFRAKQIAPNLSAKETELLLNINHNLEDNLFENYQLLLKKRADETLTEKEYQELLNITEQVEKHQAQRLKYLAELATLRGCSLTDLINKLDIRPTDNDTI